MVCAACITRELYLPPVCPLFLFPTSSSPSCEHFPGEDRCSFSPFILRARHLENRLRLRLSLSHSIIPVFIQLSARSTVRPPPFLPPSVPPAFLSADYASASLIKVPHLSISIYLSPIVFFPSVLPLLEAIPFTFPLCLKVFLSWKMLCY